MSPPGFYNAPATKGLIGLTLTTALLAGFMNKQDAIGLDSVSLFRGKLQRVLTSQFVFARQDLQNIGFGMVVGASISNAINLVAVVQHWRVGFWIDTAIQLQTIRTTTWYSQVHEACNFHTSHFTHITIGPLDCFADW